jgi:nucleoid-associated protein YgaU
MSGMKRLAVAGAVAAALWSGSPSAVVAGLRHATSPAPLIGAGAAVLAGLAAGYLALLAALVLVARRGGCAGRAASRIVRRVAPAGVRCRLALLLGVCATAAVGTTAPPAWAGPGTPRPHGRPAAGAAVDPWPAAVPAGLWPGGWGVPAAGPPVVRVRPGETLWSIAAAHLPAPVSDARIAAAWPQWYAANRPSLGPDPNLLMPGTVLVGPVVSA